MKIYPVVSELSLIPQDRKLLLEYVDGRSWRLTADMLYEEAGVVYTVPKGFVTDFASIPRILWLIRHPSDRRVALAATLHDMFYRTNTYRDSVDRLTADRLFLLGCLELGESKLVAHIMYRMLRMFGRDQNG